MNESPRLSPMFEQYCSIKKENPDAILFLRMGDFYEVFFEDAKIAAKALQLALTSRGSHKDTNNEPIPMCGVPWHVAESYFSQMVAKGYKVAVCDQIENPKNVKGLVKRAVTRVITAGTVLDDANLEAKAHNYLAALYFNEEGGALAWVDVSTGESSGFSSNKINELWQWALKLAPSELLLNEKINIPFNNKEIQIVRVPNKSHFEYQTAKQRILRFQNVQELAALGLEKQKELTMCFGAILFYLEQTQKQNPQHLQDFKAIDTSKYLILDEVTIRNLEIFQRLDGKKSSGTLWSVLDKTITSLGGRLLEHSIRNPLLERKKIEETYDLVTWFYKDDNIRNKLRLLLEDIYDIERISTRIELNRCQTKDFIALKNALKTLPKIQAIFTDLNLTKKLTEILNCWDNLSELSHILETSLIENPPTIITEGGLFKAGYNPQLDRLLDLVEHGQDKLQALLEEEQANLGSNKVKVGYNRVFGYYFEISRLTQSQITIPENWERRQSLAGAERFISPKLKELEDSLLTASDERKNLEYKLYSELRELVCKERIRLIFMSDILAKLDFWQALAELARNENYVCPELSDNQEIIIENGRHPVVEKMIASSSFIPNDIRIDESRRFILITGPNMSGKSTILRQTAIIVLLAQIGSYVPASYAKIGLVDRIFSRVGASDNLAEGQSTFMLEMMETARILRQSTKKSLLILDEIGRGTSTYDGMSIAWAVTEELAQKFGTGIRTLFATHYHELTKLEQTLPNLFNMNVAIREWQGEIIFLRRLVPGPADKSYGIEVAKLAGVPNNVIQRAKQILIQVEKKELKFKKKTENIMLKLPGFEEELPQEPIEITPPIPILSALNFIDPNKLTPLEALKTLTEWKLLWGSDTELK